MTKKKIYFTVSKQQAVKESVKELVNWRALKNTECWFTKH